MNIIAVQANHEMFRKEFSGELSNFIYDDFGIAILAGDEVGFCAQVCWRGEIDGTEIRLVYCNSELVEDDDIWYTIKLPLKAGETGGIEVYCSTNNKRYTEIGYEISCIVLRIMCYIMSAPRKRIVKKKSEHNLTTGNNGCDANIGENKIYLLDDIVEYVAENKLYGTADSGKKMCCPCWSVRGHYRHYKSGKVIFVENYLKGKDRERVEPKDKEYFA